MHGARLGRCIDLLLDALVIVGVEKLAPDESRRSVRRPEPATPLGEGHMRRKSLEGI